MITDGLYVFILCFPLIFLLGLLPQIDTFSMYVLETIDIHIFGGNASSSLISAMYCILRSLLAVGILIGFAYGGLTGEAHSKHTQEILYSIFCGLNVAISYHLSRSSSDPTTVFSLIKRQLMIHTNASNSSQDNTCVEEGQDKDSKTNEANSPMDNSTGSNDKSNGAGNSLDLYPKKLRDTVNARLKSDAISCTVIFVLTTLLHVSGFFAKLQPNLNYVLWTLTASMGFFLHYVLPQLRKQLPWLCFAHPVFKSREYGQFEVRQAAKVMWFEKAFLWLQLLEKAILLPMVILSALTMDYERLKEDKSNHWLAAMTLVICGLKLLRSAFSDSSKQFMVLLVSLLYYQFDPFENSLKGVQNPANRYPFVFYYFVVSMVFHKLYEFFLKVQFVITYIAPWQITWGSAFHAFAQPFSVPHSAMLFLQAGISAIFSTPLNPILGMQIKLRF